MGARYSNTAECWRKTQFVRQTSACVWSSLPYMVTKEIAVMRVMTWVLKATPMPMASPMSID